MYMIGRLYWGLLFARLLYTPCEHLPVTSSTLYILSTQSSIDGVYLATEMINVDIGNRVFGAV